MRIKSLVVGTFVLLLSLPTSLMAWWCDGHTVLTKASFAALPESMPAFFRAGATEAGHYVCDPDLFKNNRIPGLSAAELPEHNFDIELLDGHAVPSQRLQFHALCDSLGITPSKVGYAPYAIAEWTERLTVAFAEYRRWPANEPIKAKCLVYSGILAHYAQDMCQPLHVTVHYDGRADADGKVPHTGIHEGVDSLIERLGLSDTAIAANVSPTSFDDIRAAIHEELQRSHALVDVIYDNEQQLRAVSADPAKSFATERSEAAAQFTASLLLSAWELSESVELPGWLRR